jgi:signal transduction histidine kinase
MHDDLVAELSHQINSPLAAIRNALYLASSRTADPELLNYLQLADKEVIAIASTLRNARVIPLAVEMPTVCKKTKGVAA